MSFLSFSQLLASTAWRTKRQEALFRDGFRCCCCRKKQLVYSAQPPLDIFKNKSSGKTGEVEEREERTALRYLALKSRVYLNVFHKVFRAEISPVEQPLDDIVTLCSECIDSYFRVNPVFVLDGSGNQIGEAEVCEVCNGAGEAVNGGVCSQCLGQRRVLEESFLKLDEDGIVYPGVSRNLVVGDDEIEVVSKFFREFKDLHGLVVFLDKLQALIEWLDVSAFDDRWLVHLSPPAYGSFSRKKKVQVVVGDFIYLDFPASYGGELFRANPFPVKRIECWFKELKSVFDMAQEGSYSGWSTWHDCYYARDFKDLNNYVVYKAAVDNVFRERFINGIMK